MWGVRSGRSDMLLESGCTTLHARLPQDEMARTQKNKATSAHLGLLKVMPPPSTRMLRTDPAAAA